MSDSIRRIIAALLCIFAKYSLSASPSFNINVSQPNGSDAAGADTYELATLHNDSNQMTPNHSILVNASILNQTNFDNASSSQAVNAPDWPSRIVVQPYSNVVIDVVREQRLTDVSQAEDMKEALRKLEPKICTDRQGRRQTIQRSRAAHTWTEIFALCEDVGLDLLDQKAKLTAALRVLYQGQEEYGPAAIYGQINSHGINPRRIGEVGAHILNVPPAAPADWPEGGIIITRIHDSNTLRLRVQTVPAYPTLDIWDTMWFRKLCEQTEFWLRNQYLPPQTPMRSFWIQLDPYWKQEIIIRFEPLNVARTGAVVTIEVLLHVMETVMGILDYYGGRPMTFSVLNNIGAHIGVGYLEFGRVPPQLGVLNATMFDPVNQTAVLEEADRTSTVDSNTANQ